MHESGNIAWLRRTLKAFITKPYNSRFSFDGFPECGRLRTKLRLLTRERHLAENP